MKRVIIVFLVFCVLNSCQKGEKQLEIKLIVDEKHNQANSTETIEYYEINGTKEITIDYKKYNELMVEHNNQIIPNAIHLIINDSEYYRYELGTDNIVQINEKGINVKGKSRFSGFEKGKEYVLGVGKDNYPSNQLSFSVVWVGIIKVK
jgi:hypothetical protein